MRVEREIDLPAPRERVYGLLMDPDRLGEWVTIHERFDGAPAELSQGSEMTQRLKVAGQRFTVHWRVVEDDRPSRVTWEGRGPARTSARVVYALEERDGGTRFSYLNEYELPGGAAGRFAGRAVSAAAGREVERSLERLKRLLED
ncbi:MAG TPA: SRPBCC family protein [Thermoleophilaceae bacterium]|nr:SRPBCC family protein [Thermoleophilaceae bacterium]